MTPSTNPIPETFQSSVNPAEVSLTIVSIGKAVSGFIVFLGVIGIADPAIAGAAWGNFVQAIITAIPAGFAVYQTGYVFYGLIRKLAVRIFARGPFPVSSSIARGPTI